MKLTCHTSAVGSACRFEETNSLRSWVEYALTVVSEKFRDYTGQNAYVSVTSTDGLTTYATATLTPDPIGTERNKRFGTLILSSNNVQTAFENRCEELGVDFGPVLSEFRFRVIVGVSQTVVIDTNVPVTLAARIAGEGESTYGWTVDDALSSVSENPVQNKVVTLALDNYATQAQIDAVNPTIESIKTAMEIEAAARNTYLDYVESAIKEEVPLDIQAAIDATVAIVKDVVGQRANHVVEQHNLNLLTEYSEDYPYNDGDVATSHPDIREKLAFRVTAEAFAAHAGNSTIHVTKAMKELWNDVYDLIRIHVANDYIHINADERNSWNLSLSDAASSLNRHVSDQTALKHITAAQRTAFKAFADAFVLHAADADQFPPGYGTPNHVSDAMRTSWNGAIAALATHKAQYGDLYHIYESEREDWTGMASSVAAHVADAIIHVTSIEKTLWNNAVSHFAAHVAASNTNPHAVTYSDVGAYQKGAFDSYVGSQLQNAIDDFVNELTDEYEAVLRFKGTVENTGLLPSSAYAKPGDAWRVTQDNLWKDTDGTQKWQAAIYAYDGSDWQRTGADVTTDFTSIITTTEAQTRLVTALNSHKGSASPHATALDPIRNSIGTRAGNAEDDVSDLDSSVLKNSVLTEHVNTVLAHSFVLGQLLDENGNAAGTPDASSIQTFVTGNLADWKTDINQMIVESDLQCAVKFKGELGVPVDGGGTKTREYSGTTVAETVETVDEAKVRLGANATAGDVYSVYNTPIMYVYGGGVWHTVGFEVSQDTVNEAATRITKLAIWGKYPYNPAAPEATDAGYVAPTDFEAGHDTDNTAHHTSAWFLAWQTIRESLTSYKVLAFLPEAIDRLGGQEILASGFTVNPDGKVCKNSNGTLVPYTDSYGNTISTTLAAGTVCGGVSATQALIATTVASLMPGFATQGENILFSYVQGTTITSATTGDFNEGIEIAADGSLVDSATGETIVTSQGVPVFEGYHKTVTEFDTRKLRVTWNPIAGLGGSNITWTPGTKANGDPTGVMDLPVYCIDEDGNEAGKLDITTIAAITANFSTLVNTSPAPAVGAKYWCKSAAKLYSYTGSTSMSDQTLTTFDQLVEKAFLSTAYVAGTAIFSTRTYLPAKYDRYWVSGPSKMFYFSGRGDITANMINNGRYVNIENAVTDLDALARAAVNRGSNRISAPPTGSSEQMAATLQSQRFYVRSTNKMYVFSYSANSHLTDAELQAVSTRLAQDDHTPYTESELVTLGFTASAETSVASNFIVDDMARFGWTVTDLSSTDLARFGWTEASSNCWNTPTTQSYIREIITGSATGTPSENVASYFATEAAKKCIVASDGTTVQECALATAPFSPLTISTGTDGTKTLACYKGIPQLNVYHSSPTLVSGYNGDQVMILRKTRTIVGEYTLTSEAVTNDSGSPIDIVYCRDGGLWYQRDEITANVVINRLKDSIVSYFKTKYDITYSDMQQYDRACQSDPISGFLWYHRTLYSAAKNRMFELVFRFCIDNTGLNSEQWTVFETTDLAPETTYHGYCQYTEINYTHYATFTSGFSVSDLFARVKSGLFVVNVECTSNNRMMIAAGGGHNGRWVKDTKMSNTNIGSTTLNYVSARADYILLHPKTGVADGTQYPFHFSAAVFKNRNAITPVYNTDIFTVPDVDPSDSAEVDSLYWLVVGTVKYLNPVLTVFDWRNNQVLLYVLDGTAINPTRENLRGVRTLGANGTPAPLTTLSDTKRIYTKATMSLKLSNNAAYPADCGVLLQVDSYVWFFKYSQLNFEFELLASRRFLDYLVGDDGTDITYSSQSTANSAKNSAGSAYVVEQQETGVYKVGKDYTPTSIGFYCHFSTGADDEDVFKLVATTDSFIYYYVVDRANHKFANNTACVCLMPNPHYEVDNYAEYSESKTYAVGDRVAHEDYVYRCKTAITTPMAWNSNYWVGEFESFEGRQIIARRGLLDGSIKQWKSSPIQAVFGTTDFVCTAYMQKGNLDRYQPAVLDYDGQRTDYGGRVLKAKTLVLMRGFRKFKVYMANGVLTSEEIEKTGEEGRNNGKDIFYTQCSAGHKVGILGERGKTYRIQCPYCKTTNVVTIQGVSED